MTNIGIALLITGIPITAKGNRDMSYYKNAMEQSKKNKNLSFGITNNGVGLVLNL